MRESLSGLVVTDVATDRRTLVVTTACALADHSVQLRARGVEVVCLPAYDDGRVDLEALLRYLGERGIASVLVEGGATLSTTLLTRRLIDKVLFFVAPKIIGGDGISVVGACNVETMEQVAMLLVERDLLGGEEVGLGNRRRRCGGGGHAKTTPCA